MRASCPANESAVAAHLQQIDRSFVRHLAGSTDLAITRAIIGLGHTLGLRVVAEGVEDAVAAEALRGAQCDELRGYRFAKPLPPAEFAAWVLRRGSEESALQGRAAAGLLTSADG
jgi:EAL domain-containing protein (putative c-di-GMP-specific phosphodiesterase class I)